MKTTITAVLAGLLVLSATGCGQNEDAATAAPDTTQEAEESSFTAFMQGTWACDGRTEYANADVRTPGMNGWNYDLDDVKVVVEGDSLEIDVDDMIIEASVVTEGRTTTITTDIGTQVIENMPETFDYALEPVDIEFVGTDGNDDETLRIQALGERQLSISDDEATSICVKS